MELVEADICRDGGSIVADFRCSDGSLLSILLEVSRNFDGYGHLHVGTSIQNQCQAETIVAKGSRAEQELLAALDAWIERQAAWPSDDSADQQGLHRVSELRNHLQHRAG